MAQDVNQRKMDVAAQVRSALIERISSERFELWIPENTQWCWNEGVLQITFSSDFSCQLARRTLAPDILDCVSQVVGFAAEVKYLVSRELEMAACTTVQAAAVPAPLDAVGVHRGLSAMDRDHNKALQAVVASTHQPIKECIGQRRRGFSSNSDRPPTPRDAGGPETGKEFPRKDIARNASSTATSQTVDIWEQYVQGPSNQLAWTTANLVVSEPGRLSPVLLYGPNGCGKSYLAAAIAEQLRTLRRMRRVVHMSSEQFTNDFMEGLRGGGLPMFRRKYRDVEALILDDIQFFVGKKSTIGELRHTLDNLMRSGKQVLLTADRTLNELQALGGDLVGRLRSGMVTPLFPLDENTRAEVIRRHFVAAGLNIRPEIISRIASRATGDGRVLSGIAKRMIAFSTLHTEELGWEQCWGAIHDLVQSTQPVIRIADIERAVCGMFGLEPESLQSSAKTRSVSQPRMLAMFLSRKYTPAAYKEIGEYFGKRKHSTVISAEKTVESWLADNSDIVVGRGLTVRDALRQVESQLQVG